MKVAIVSDLCFTVALDMLKGREEFREASREELRTLIAVIGTEGVPTTYEKLSELADVSLARAKSAVALFEELGVIKRADELALVTDEFALKEATVTAKAASETIRDESLAELFDECAVLLMRPEGLSGDEVKVLSSLVSEGGLSSEYIAGLIAYMAEKFREKQKKLTVRDVVRKAESLIEKGVDTLEGLEIYIMNKDSEVKGEWEYRRVLGLFGREPSDAEREAFRRWSVEYCYSTAIIKAAYNIACMNINVNSNPVAYMDKIIGSWYSAGCRTVEECLAEHERGKTENQTKETARRPAGKKSCEAEKPKFSDFDSEDALKRALERSYGSGDN